MKNKIKTLGTHIQSEVKEISLHQQSSLNGDESEKLFKLDEGDVKDIKGLVAKLNTIVPEVNGIEKKLGILKDGDKED